MISNLLVYLFFRNLNKYFNSLVCVFGFFFVKNIKINKRKT